MAKEKINRYIQKAFLLVAVISSIQLLHVPQWISCVECLIRTDFNFAFALFCYYLWISDKTNSTANYVPNVFLSANPSQLLIFTGVVTVVDCIWLFVMWAIWTKKLKHNSAWNNFSYLHYFTLILAVINIILKVKFLLVNMLILWCRLLLGFC